MAESTYKVVLVGDGGVGKSAFTKRFINGDFESRYIPTLGVDVHRLTFSTNYGKLIFDVWDTAGQDKFGGLRSGYSVGAHAFIGFFDVTDKTTAFNMDRWHKEMVGDMKVPLVVCGNKSDQMSVVSDEDKQRLGEKWGHYYDVSVMSMYNYEKPFLYLARLLTGKADLIFTIEQDQEWDGELDYHEITLQNIDFTVGVHANEIGSLTFRVNISDDYYIDVDCSDGDQIQCDGHLGGSVVLSQGLINDIKKAVKIRT